MKLIFRLLVLLFLAHSSVWAAEVPSEWYSKNADNQVIINIEMFLSSTCSHCQKADAFFKKIQAENPDFHVQRYYVDKDKNALMRFNQLLNEQQMGDFAVPSIYFCNSRWVGFASDESTGKELIQAINYCKKQIEKKGTLTQETVNALRQSANANRFITGLTEKPTPLKYTTITALMDSFGPCATFTLMGFLAFLIIETQRKNQITASLIFVFSIAIVHYFQQTNSSFFYQIVPWFRIPAVLVGLMTLYFVMHYFKNRCIKPLYFSLAFLVGGLTTIYQQTCLMNWAIVYEQWLKAQNLSIWQTSGYQLLYQGLYILPLILIIFFYSGLVKTNRLAALNTRLTRIGLLFLIAIALILIFNPWFLSHLGASLLLLLVLLFSGYFLNFKTKEI